MTGWTDYVSAVVAVVGVVQAVFLCLILRSEGARAFGANRWMMLFIAAVALNLIEDVLDPLVAGDFADFLKLFFGPINYAIGPAIYLYFREISGNPSRRPWGHFVLPLVVFNLIAWIVTHRDAAGTRMAGQYTPWEACRSLLLGGDHCPSIGPISCFYGSWRVDISAKPKNSLVRIARQCNAGSG